MADSGGAASGPSKPHSKKDFQKVVAAANSNVDRALIPLVSDQPPVPDTASKETYIWADKIEETKVSDPNVPLTSLEEQKKLFFRHLGPEQISNPISDDEIFYRVREMCGGLPLALTIVARFLRSEGKNLLPSLEALQISFFQGKKHDKAPSVYTGVRTIFGAVLSSLDESHQRFPQNFADVMPPANFPYSWTDLYTSLSVLEKSAPHAPVGILADLWGIEVQHAERICSCFASLGLGTLDSTDRISARDFRLDDLQRECCMIRNRHSSNPTISVASWHARLLDGLVRKAGDTIIAGTAAEFSLRSASPSPAGQYVQAFCTLLDEGEEHWLVEYWVNHFVRHVSRIEEGVIIARDVVTDYRWIRKAAEYRHPAIVAHGIDWLLKTNAAEEGETHASFGAALSGRQGLSSMHEQEPE